MIRPQHYGSEHSCYVLPLVHYSNLVILNYCLCFHLAFFKVLILTFCYLHVNATIQLLESSFPGSTSPIDVERRPPYPYFVAPTVDCDVLLLICLLFLTVLLFLLFEQMSLLMYDVHNNFAPDNIKNMFTKLTTVHSYRTRSVTNENYYVENVRTENMKRAFSISGALIWNSIPLPIKALKRKNQFQSALKGKLFEILEKEDDYIRISDIYRKQFSKS